MPYEPQFLPGEPVPPPVPPVQPETVLDYVHFTISMNLARRLAWWAAWNIDGTTLFPDIPRESRFYPDPRIPRQAQTTEEVYAGNDLDRGHLARRSDLLWGTYEAAIRANHDSFCFTNISPQLNTFNQSRMGGVWGELENAVLDLDGLIDRRLSVLAGPVLRDDDPPYRDLVQLPREYWKVVVYVVEGVLRCRAFLLTQDLDDLGFLEEFQTYQVDLLVLADRTTMSFGGLAALEPQTEAAAPAVPRLVTRLDELRL